MANNRSRLNDFGPSCVESFSFTYQLNGTNGIEKEFCFSSMSRTHTTALDLMS